ncbi:MAG: imidazoleglycerol-phosphate dehydratase HisB [Candidatus Omnitrophica bacterium]|jgi:imidazoleglycerol-phosphate dehydratase|nr:imidazoleglycerol-phosphate dehydratase HisB [Candidatus Omnitrophota bacterium]
MGKIKSRKAEIRRKTKETYIIIKLNIDGTGKSKINTGIGILDHMLELFAFHGLFDLEIAAKGDLKVDIHHTNEDIGIVLGDAFKKALGDKKGIRRFGSISVPMEEVVATVALDISGRGFLKFKTDIPKFTGKSMAQEEYKLEYAEHFFESLAKHLGINLNINVSPYSPDIHTTLEPVFKALGIALAQATQIDPRRKGIPSTKGIID